MLRLIGAAVVYGFALYGVSAYLERTTLKVHVRVDPTTPGKDTSEPTTAGVTGEGEVSATA